MAFAKDEVRIYRHDPGKLDEAIAAGERRVRILGGCMVAVAMGLVGYQALASPGTLPAPPIWTTVLPGGLVLGMMAWVYVRSRRELRRDLARNWDAYCLAVSANAMRYADGQTVPVEIVRPRVVRISEQAGVGITVATVESGRFLFLPASLGRYEELREHLSSWQAIQGIEPWTTRYGRVGWFFAQLLLAVCSWIIPDLRIAGVFAFGAVVAGILAIRQARAMAAASEDQKAGMVRASLYFLFGTVARFVIAAVLAWSGTPGGPTNGSP